MQLTRKQILQYLQKKHIATALELGNSLNVTAANIRHHLSELINQNLIEEFGNLPGKGRGRPTKLYRLSHNSLDNNLACLSNVLLSVLMENVTNSGAQEQMLQIAQVMIGEYATSRNLFQRLNLAITWLNERHYKSRWEASPTGPRLILGFCPYIAIIDTNPDLCQFDKALISQLIGLPVTQTEKLDRSPNGARQCIFLSRA